MEETTQKKLLIVEDNQDFLWLLRQSFDNQGLAVSYAMDGEEGLAAAQKERPDLMLIDIDMPKMDGIAMAKKIKEAGINPQMIFLTNVKDAEHISQAMETAGEADYIVKSDVHIDAIVERVKIKLGLLKP